MSHGYFLTITARDHHGVLPAITTALSELGGDMQHANQSIVHGLFTMTIAVTFPDHRSLDVIRDHLLHAGRHYQMQVMIRDLADEVVESRMIGQTYFLVVSGKDAPGVVRIICGMLAQHQIQIESLTAVPEDAETFSMVMKLTVARSVEIEQLSHDLNLFGSLNGLSITVADEESFFHMELLNETRLNFAIDQ